LAREREREREAMNANDRKSADCNSELQQPVHSPPQCNSRCNFFAEEKKKTQTASERGRERERERVTEILGSTVVVVVVVAHLLFCESV
jgi:hypothetical protein